MNLRNFHVNIGKEPALGEVSPLSALSGLRFEVVPQSRCHFISTGRKGESVIRFYFGSLCNQYEGSRLM